MTPLLTWFVTSVNNFLMSSWSQSLVSSLLQHGTMFILLVTVSFRAKQTKLSEGKLLRDSISATSNQVILLSSTLSSNHGHFWLRKTKRWLLKIANMRSDNSFHIYVNILSLVKCSIKDFLYTDLGLFVSSELKCQCEKPPNISTISWHCTVSATVFSSAQTESFPLRVRPIIRTSDPHQAECPTPACQLHIHPLLFSFSPRHEWEKQLRSQFWHSMPAGWAAQ